MRKLSHAVPPAVRVEWQRNLRGVQRPRQAAFASGALLLLFLAFVYSAAPSHLPLLIQSLVGLTNACLVMLFVTCLLKELGDWRGNFGVAPARFGQAVAAVGWLCFALVLAWWLTPLAPITAY